MPDAIEEALTALGEARPMDPAFRDRLERTLVGDRGGPRERWVIDAPRAMPARLRSRIENAMVARRRIPVARFLAAGIAAAVVASTLVVVDRTGAPKRAPIAAAPIATPPPSPTPTPTQSPTAPRPAAFPPGSLRAFRSEGEFLAYARRQALRVVAEYGAVQGTGFPYMDRVAVGPAPAAPAGAPAAMPPGAATYSQTNIQEDGVDEPDSVKTDGSRLVVALGDRVRVLSVTGRSARLRGTVRVPPGDSIFLVGDRVIQFSQRFDAPDDARLITHVQDRAWTTVSIISIADPARPHVVATMEIEGAYVGARLAKGVVRLVVQSGALGPPQVHAGPGDARANARAVRRSVLGDWVPHYVVTRPHRRPIAGHIHGWSAVSRPPGDAGLSMLSVVTIDPADPRPDNAVSVLGAGQILYADVDSLYVTSNGLDDLLAVGRGSKPRGAKPGGAVTRIHKFDVSDPTRTRYVGSGQVPGYLLNQYSLSEDRGYLRVATSLAPPWFDQPSLGSAVHVFAQRNDRLARVGSVTNLAPGERIYSVRFVGAVGYVVTFRLIDPLFVIDLRTPTRPRVRGRLKMPGYSGYLHPISDTRLLGVGRGVDERGEPLGVQVSLFDVASLSRPRRLDVDTYGDRGNSLVEDDPHAFLDWSPRRLVVIPVQLYRSDGTIEFSGALAMRAGATSLGNAVRISHMGRNGASPYAWILRSVVVGTSLLTVSEAGVLVSDLQTFADRRWVSFG
jgi:uncharacterized secreted protein with C-terminal beta-propeller domain